MRRLLPVVMPPVVGYLHHAFPLSVLLTQRGAMPWFMSNYVQMTCPAVFDFEASVKRRCQKLDFFSHPASEGWFSPLLETSWFDKRAMGSGDDLVAFLIRSIDSGYRVELCADQFFIPGSAAYRERHFVHEVLVTGYDFETRSFIVSIGFDRAGDYVVDEIDFDEIACAVTEADLTGHYNRLGACLIRPRRGTRFDFDLQWFVAQVSDYVTASDTSGPFLNLGNVTPQRFGIATYDFLIEYFAYLEDHPDCYDIRPIHIFWEHKKCVLERLRYLEGKRLIRPGRWSTWYADVEQRVSMFRMMMLKARVTRDLGLVRRIRAGLPDVRELETLCLERALEALRFAHHQDCAEDTTRCREGVGSPASLNGHPVQGRDALGTQGESEQGRAHVLTGSEDPPLCAIPEVAAPARA